MTAALHISVSPPSARARRRARAAALVGSTVEWYDYFVFATASAVVFGEVFFPGSDPLIGALQSFAVLGVGFVARPLGGLVLGRIGDRVGRKPALLITLWTMGIATTAIGLLPTSAQIGAAAPVLLVALRLVQGFGVGGEWGGASLVAVENAPADRRARWGSLPQMGTALGATLATAVFALVAMLPQDALISWGWRMPFLLSAVIVGVGLWIRSGLLETADFAAVRASGETADHPVAESLAHERRPLLLAVGMRLAENTWGYLVLVFALTYVPELGQHDRTAVLWSVCLAVVGGLGCYWAAATLADWVGRKPVYLCGGAFGIAFAWPFFALLESSSIVAVWLALLLGWGVASGACFSIQPAWFAELFGRRTRYVGLSLAYNVATMVSGFTPFLAALLLRWADGEPTLIAVLLVATGAVSLACAACAPDPYRVSGDRYRAGCPRR